MIPGWCDQDKNWSNIKIGNEEFMVCVTKKNGVIKVFLTNLVEIWSETLTEENILEKCRNLNRLLNVNSLNCHQLVTDILNDIPKHITEASAEQIKLQTCVEGRTMKFALNLSKGTADDFWEIITKPLCFTSMELIRQNKILLDLIKRKDEEIYEYKAEGAELIRKHIETETFDEEQLKIDFPIPKFADYINTFQNMMSFYNKLDLHQHTRCVNSKSEKVEQMEQDAIGINESNNTTISKELISNAIPTEGKAGSSVSNDTVRTKKKQADVKTATNKKKTMNSTYKPVKRSKNSLKSFL